MKRISLLLTLIFAIGLTSGAFAQLSNLIFFTENGERFTVILNGVRQNPTPETNVKVTDLPAPSYKLKVIFDDPALGELDKNLMFNQGTESTFVIKANKKSEYVVRWMNEVSIAQALPPAPNQQVIVYSTQAPPASTVTQTTTTVSESYGQPQQGNVSMGININDPELGVNINMNVNGGGVSSGSQVTTTHTTSSYSTTSGTDGYPPAQSVQQAYVLPGYNGPVGCPYPMHPGDFQSVKQSIASKTFDDTRLTIAKQVISSNCLLSDQVKEIMLLFTFEDTRLDLAKYAYGYTYDIGNYYRLNDAFDFESSIEDLNDYMGGFRR